MAKNTTDILRTKAMLNFAFSLILMGRKKRTFHYPGSNVPILIRNDSLTSEESKTENCL